jgi:hypothetical protein
VVLVLVLQALPLALLQAMPLAMLLAMLLATPLRIGHHSTSAVGQTVAKTGGFLANRRVATTTARNAVRCASRTKPVSFTTSGRQVGVKAIGVARTRSSTITIRMGLS